MGSSKWWSTKTVAVVTGANKGIGLEIVRQLASKGITVVLTARDANRGRAAVEGLHNKGLKNVDFHPLDINNHDSVTEFAGWLNITYGGLDILVNNAAVLGVSPFNEWTKELAIRDVKTNYVDTKNVTETLLPLLKQSDAGARIVFLNSLLGQLNYLNHEEAREQLTDPDQFTEATVDEIAAQYIAACEAGQEEGEKWGLPYAVSKVLLAAYARQLAKRLASRPKGEKLYVTSVHPGVVKTDAYDPKFVPGIEVDEGADTAVWVALLPEEESDKGNFYYERKEYSYEDDSEDCSNC